MSRCFGEGDELMAAYHDEEWGVPVRDPQRLFEHLTLDLFQSGLSWRVILSKREGFRRAFDDFYPDVIARYDEADITRLLADDGIVRNRRKIFATITNARAYRQLDEEGEDFSQLLWQFSPGERGKRVRTWDEVPTSSPESAAMAKALKARGFSFVGPTVCYAFMQAVGIVDDHMAWCFRAA
jgi:DNA-3-methyladenine glycosylase I